MDESCLAQTAKRAAQIQAKINGDVYKRQEMHKRNLDKAKVFYDFMDSSKMFKGTVEPEFRSLMNIPFAVSYTHLRTGAQPSDGNGTKVWKRIWRLSICLSVWKWPQNQWS